MAIKKATLDYINDETTKYLETEYVFDNENFGSIATPKENIKVKLLYAPNWNEWVKPMFFTAFTTWNNEHEIDLNKISEEKRERLFCNFLQERPISAVLESATFVFDITGIPRTMTHQIVRHRGMSFNQQSYRVSPAHHEHVRVPEGLDEKEQEDLKFLFDELRKKYVKLINDGFPTEQVRNILPMGTCTRITMTTRLSDLRGYIRARTLGIAQDEHTLIVAMILKELKEKAPEFYDVFIKSDVTEETMKNYLGGE